MTDKEKLIKIKKLADAMYFTAFNMTTDASLLMKAMKEYHQFIINEECKKEPVSENLEKAEERAMEAYPPKFTSQKRYSKRIQSEKTDVHQSARTIYIKGYRQAEKDLELR